MPGSLSAGQTAKVAAESAAVAQEELNEDDFEENRRGWSRGVAARWHDRRLDGAGRSRFRLDDRRGHSRRDRRRAVWRRRRERRSTAAAGRLCAGSALLDGAPPGPRSLWLCRRLSPGTRLRVITRSASRGETRGAALLKVISTGLALTDRRIFRRNIRQAQQLAATNSCQAR